MFTLEENQCIFQRTRTRKSKINVSIMFKGSANLFVTDILRTSSALGNLLGSCNIHEMMVSVHNKVMAQYAATSITKNNTSQVVRALWQAFP